MLFAGKLITIIYFSRVSGSGKTNITFLCFFCPAFSMHGTGSFGASLAMVPSKDVQIVSSELGHYF